MANDPKPWFVYILKCSDNTLYTGITTDPDRRLHEHNHTDKGARYTKKRRPVSRVYLAEFPDRKSAMKEEYRIKKLSRRQKLALIPPQNS